jgi:hypothetical protein
MVKKKRTNKYLQHITQRTKDRAPQTQLKIRVNSTRVTRHVILQYILKNQKKNRSS